MNVILIAVIVLGSIGLVAALVLYFISKKFAVKEDPRIALVTEALPGANCGGCGYPGCSGLAGACVKGADSGSIEGLYCPVGGDAVMSKVAAILGMEASASEPKLAVVRCNGSCAARPRIAKYDGLMTCRAVHACGAGETGCGFGCLGCGDCVAACKFDAIHINPETGLPEVDEEKCVACGACVKACPRNIIELRPKGKGGKRVWVGCVNQDKGAVAMKVCTVSCIGCGKCEKACKFDAITIANNLSYIDGDKCKACRACMKVCPRDCIYDANFPKSIKEVMKAEAERKAAAEAKAKAAAEASGAANANAVADKAVEQPKKKED